MTIFSVSRNQISPFVRPFLAFFMGLSILALSTLLNAQASDRPMIEFGATGGGTFTQPWNGASGVGAGGGTVDARLEFLFIDAQARFTGASYNGQPGFEFSASGGLLFLKLHELYIRRDTPNGNMDSVAAGLGGSFDLPADLGEIGASLGVIAMDIQRPATSTAPASHSQLLGGYLGGHLYLHIWKFENELRVAYYATPQVNTDLLGIVGDGSVTGSEIVTGWTTGLVASNVLRFNAFKIGILSLGPEVAARAMQLPDGAEYMVSFGLGGRIGVL
jgi:hypothetical protein